MFLVLTQLNKILVFCCFKEGGTNMATLLFRSRLPEDSDHRRLLQYSNESLDGWDRDQAAAFQHVRDNIDDLNSSVGAQDIDLIFLKGLMDSPVMKSLVKAHDRLEDTTLEPVRTNNTELVTDVLGEINTLTKKDSNARELAQILQNVHFKALVDAHDTVAAKCYETMPEPINQLSSPPPPFCTSAPTDAIRMVGIRKNPNEPLGVTVKVEDGQLVIARILGGGMIDRQGLLHVGDIIKEVNGKEVNTPDQLQEQMKKAEGGVTLKILPSYVDILPTSQVYVKTHFNYDPSKDGLIPCKDVGLTFRKGDILQIVNQDDPNWWQAKQISSSQPAGLIPSQQLEEKRKAFVKPEHNYTIHTTFCGTITTKKKRKMMYQSRKNAEFDRCELLLYEEVARMPPFQRKTLVLIGAQGVGRRSLKNKLISSDPTRFGTTMPHTSRMPYDTEEDGKSYFFVTKESMEADIGQNRYLEFGEYAGNLYGTKLDSIRAVIRSGKMCILDCNPQALKFLNSAEFMPFVVFIAAPSLEQLRKMNESDRDQSSSKNKYHTFDRAVKRREESSRASNWSMTEDDMKRTVEESARIQSAYESHFDLSIMNSSFEETFDVLKGAVEELSIESQWVPVTWVY